MKECKKCLIKKDKNTFPVNKRNKDGLHSWCTACRREYNNVYTKNYRKTEVGKQKLKEYQKSQKRKDTREKNKKSNPKIYRTHNKKYYEKIKNNPEYKIKRKLYYKKYISDPDIKERYKNVSKEYRRKNSHKVNSWTMKRICNKKKATPHWYEKKKIEILYEKAKWLESLTGLKYHIDHVIPLQSKKVCGLHVWSNLQILEKTINIKKGNSFFYKY